VNDSGDRLGRRALAFGLHALALASLGLVAVSCRATDDEQRFYAMVYERDDASQPILEEAVLDAERSGTERYAALEALSYWDSPAAIATLERLRGGFTAEDQQLVRIAVEGALAQVIRQHEAKKSSGK
jgi:hypothetical protein